jgi:hypothetical protein
MVGYGGEPHQNERNFEFKSALNNRYNFCNGYQYELKLEIDKE